MEILRQFFSGEQGLKRSHAFINFANMLTGPAEDFYRGDSWGGELFLQQKDEPSSEPKKEDKK